MSKTKKERDYDYEMKRETIYGKYGPKTVPFQRAASVTSDAEERIRKKYKDRGKSGIKQMLKEIDAVSSAVCRNEEQVIQTLQYVIGG